MVIICFMYTFFSQLFIYLTCFVVTVGWSSLDIFKLSNICECFVLLLNNV